MLWTSCCSEDAHIGYIVFFQGEDDENDEGDNGDSGRMDGDYEYEGSGDNEDEEDNEAEDGEDTEEGDEEEDSEVDEDETLLHGEHRTLILIIPSDMSSLQLHHHPVKRRN
jgi:hypothetical protein